MPPLCLDFFFKYLSSFVEKVQDICHNNSLKIYQNYENTHFFFFFTKTNLKVSFIDHFDL